MNLYGFVENSPSVSVDYLGLQINFYCPPAVSFDFDIDYNWDEFALNSLDSPFIEDIDWAPLVIAEITVNVAISGTVHVKCKKLECDCTTTELGSKAVPFSLPDLSYTQKLWLTDVVSWGKYRKLFTAVKVGTDPKAVLDALTGLGDAIAVRLELDNYCEALFAE